MVRIMELLVDPGWWFTAVFVALLISLAGSFLRDPILSVLARVSASCRLRKQKRDAELKERVEELLRDSTLFVLSSCIVTFQLCALGGLIAMYAIFTAMYVSLPAGADFRARMVLGIMGLLCGGACLYGMNLQSPRVQAIYDAYSEYRSRVAGDTADPGVRSDPLCPAPDCVLGERRPAGERDPME